jgi:hypothetical protein
MVVSVLFFLYTLNNFFSHGFIEKSKKHFFETK